MIRSPIEKEICSECLVGIILFSNSLQDCRLSRTSCAIEPENPRVIVSHPSIYLWDDVFAGIWGAPYGSAEIAIVTSVANGTNYVIEICKELGWKRNIAHLCRTLVCVTIYSTFIRLSSIGLLNIGFIALSNVHQDGSPNVHGKSARNHPKEFRHIVEMSEDEAFVMRRLYCNRMMVSDDRYRTLLLTYRQRHLCGACNAAALMFSWMPISINFK